MRDNARASALQLRWCALFLAVSLALPAASGCRKKRVAAPAVPPPTIATDRRARAEADFERGDYSEATAAYESLLSRNLPISEEPRVLFRLALSYALPESPVHNPDRAIQLLTRLIEEHPDSPYGLESRLILGLLSRSQTLESQAKRKEEEIRKLAEELEKLKAIDLRRRPPRPPSR
ncbi:MAG: tetratricopeptide repeat protein [Acidobacteriota bacterium]